MKVKLLDRFDYIWWMGDFNYRININDQNEVMEKIKKKQFLELMQFD